MDSFFKENSKQNTINNNFTKLMIPTRSRSNYYSSPENLIKYLRSSSHSSSGNSSSGKSSFRSSMSPKSEMTPVNVVEDDVLVVDGVLVASDTNILGSNSSSSPGSVGFYKSEICRAWEEFGNCRYGSRCQFAHGKEEVRPTCFPFKSKSEVKKSYASVLKSPHGSRSRPGRPQTETAATRARKDSPTRPDYTGKRPITPIKLEETILNFTSTVQPENTPSTATKGQSFSTPVKLEETTLSSTSTIQSENTPLTANFVMQQLKTNQTISMITTDNGTTTFNNDTNWSPEDDGIDATLPSRPGETLSREEFNAYVDSVLYGETTKRRLPVFSEICPQ